MPKSRRRDSVPGPAATRTDAAPPPLSRPFAALAAASTARIVASGAPPAGDAVTRARKLVLRRERKGFGGKTATRVSGLAGRREELEALAREWKRALGCGAVVDGADVLVQGDQCERLAALLKGRGATSVVVGN